jgi:hypothetical protein
MHGSRWRELETGTNLTTGTGMGQPTGKPAAPEGLRPYRRRSTAPAPDPTKGSVVVVGDQGSHDRLAGVPVVPDRGGQGEVSYPRIRGGF